jgi:hypothetical protein
MAGFESLRIAGLTLFGVSLPVEFARARLAFERSFIGLVDAMAQEVKREKMRKFIQRECKSVTNWACKRNVDECRRYQKQSYRVYFILPDIYNQLTCLGPSVTFRCCIATSLSDVDHVTLLDCKLKNLERINAIIGQPLSLVETYIISGQNSG